MRNSCLIAPLDVIHSIRCLLVDLSVSVLNQFCIFSHYEASATRQAQTTAIDQVLVDRRTKTHLDELEKSNYTEPVDEQHAVEGGARRGHRGAVRHTLISDQRADDKKNKSTMNVRSALMYKKNLATLIEESVSEF
jgi:hypothetical protein